MGKYLASLLIIQEGNQPRDREMVVEDLSPDPRGSTSQLALLDFPLLWKTISFLLSQLLKVNLAVSLSLDLPAPGVNPGVNSSSGPQALRLSPQLGSEGMRGEAISSQEHDHPLKNSQ